MIKETHGLNETGMPVRNCAYVSRAIASSRACTEHRSQPAAYWSSCLRARRRDVPSGVLEPSQALGEVSLDSVACHMKEDDAQIMSSASVVCDPASGALECEEAKW